MSSSDNNSVSSNRPATSPTSSSLLVGSACVAFGSHMNARPKPAGYFDRNRLVGRLYNGSLSKDMIGPPRGDVVHTLHIGLTGETFGDIGHLTRAIGSIEFSSAPSGSLQVSHVRNSTLKIVKSKPAFQPSAAVAKKGLKFGRRMKGLDKTSDHSNRTSATSDEILYSLLPEEPRIDFGPSFYDEVMLALTQRIPQHSILKSKFSDFVSSNGCDFSDSESSSMNRVDFSETDSQSSSSNTDRKSETETTLSGLLLRTLGVSSSDNKDTLIAKSNLSIPGTLRSRDKMDNSRHPLRCKISAPVQLICDSRLVKGSTMPVRQQPAPSTSAPPLPDLASMGSKLTSADNVMRDVYASVRYSNSSEE